MPSIIQSRHGAVIKSVFSDLKRKASASDLPDRISVAVKSQDDASEILIKLIQLALVTVFAILYLIARKTDAGTSFAPVPYILAAYFILNLGGLVWALNRRIPDWAIYLSIILDISLLLVLILSFHIQYKQPASFFLKAPTFLYIFIFIAIRALRFQPRFVLITGLAAITGWIAMIFYVITSDPENTMITKSYVDYLTSNSILIGAEVDKIISVLVVTLVLCLALKRGQFLLVQAITEQSAARDLSRFFDQSVADRIRQSDQQVQAGEGVKRQAAILNVDIRNFTSLSEKISPDSLMSLLSEYQRRIVPIIHKNGGTIDKFLGDGIMGTFGAVHDSDDYAAAALSTIDDVIAETETWMGERRDQGKFELNINASVAIGPIIFGAVGGSDRLEYTVIGPAVNLSSKLEKHNKHLGVRALTTRAAYTTAKSQGYRRDNEARDVISFVPGTEEEQNLVVLHESSAA